MSADPRQVGETWHSSDWRMTYTVLAWVDYPDWRGRSIRVRWEDGRITTHGTPVGRDTKLGADR